MADAVNITADRDQPNQVWMNLLGNSIKFTPVGGHIEIRIPHSVNEISFTITDSGIGIAPEQLDYVFERFYKTNLLRNRCIDDNGLGLAVAKKIVTLHHGSIEKKSQVGQGKTVVAHLPIRQL